MLALQNSRHMAQRTSHWSNERGAENRWQSRWFTNENYPALPDCVFGLLVWSGAPICYHQRLLSVGVTNHVTGLPLKSTRFGLPTSRPTHLIDVGDCRDDAMGISPSPLDRPHTAAGCRSGRLCSRHSADSEESLLCLPWSTAQESMTEQLLRKAMSR